MSSASAAPSIGGSTGNLVTPSADFMREGQFHAAWIDEPDGGHAFAAAFPLSRRLEISGIQHHFGGRQEATLGLKYALVTESVLVPGIAVGAEDLTNERERSAYAVVSKTLPLGIRVHAGMGSGRYKKGIAALEMRLNPTGIAGLFPDTSVFWEHVNSHTAYGLRVSLFRGIKVAAGVDGHRHFAAVSYNFY